MKTQLKTFPVLITFTLIWGLAAPIATWAWLTNASPVVEATNPERVGRTEQDRKRNASLLAGYEYDKYVVAITGYNGQDRQHVVFWDRQHAVRTRVGPRGNYKCGMTLLKDGKLLLATCKNNNDDDPTKKIFDIFVYASTDNGESWKMIGETPLSGKEPSLPALPDGSVVLSAQKGYFGPGTKYKEEINLARSTDGGRTWQGTKITYGEILRKLHKDSKFLEKAPSATGRNVLELKDGTLVLPLVHSTDPRCYGDFGQRQNLGQNTDM